MPSQAISPDVLRRHRRFDGEPDLAAVLRQALAELGRIVKTLFLLAYGCDPYDLHYRRRILLQLNRGRAATRWREPSSSGDAASCTSRTGRARRTSSAPSAWW